MTPLPLRYPHRLFEALFLAALAISAATMTYAESIPIAVDPRIEAASIVSRLAGLDGYSQPGVTAYDRAVKEWFAPYASHPAVSLLAKLNRKNQIGYDAPVALALVLDPVTFQPRVPLDPRPSFLQESWTPPLAKQFAAALALFVKDSNFTGFMVKTAGMQRNVEQALAKSLGGGVDLDWFRRQYNVPLGSRFTVAPALLSARNSYGLHVTFPDGRMEVTLALATPSVDDASNLAYPDAAIMGLLVHELSHAFVNPWVDANAKSLLPHAAKLYAIVRSSMQSNAYGSPRIMLYESIVRGMAVRYAREHALSNVERYSIQDDRSKDFLWTDALATRLAADPPLPFHAAGDRVIAFFTEWGADATARVQQVRIAIAAEQADRLKRGPQITRLVPANGDMSVDATVDALEIQFDRPMQPGISIFGDVPEVVGKPAWNAEFTVLRVPVKMSPGRVYVMQLNSDGDGDFVSKEGQALVPREWRFQVRGRK
ncbi:MAG: DUF4932 domain-containing protein [Acidobacteriota bacterium]